MDKKHCIYCGTQNSSRAEFCTKCGKEMNPTENLFIDFLVKRTKDKFKDEAETSVYEALKNFLLSHLYGVMLTISFVSAVAVTSYASEPYIQKIDNDYLETFNSLFNQYENIDGEYPMEYNTAVHNLITSYEIDVLNEVLRDARGNMVTPDPDRYRLPASMGYGGQHQLNPSIPAYIDGAAQSGVKERTEFAPEFYQRDISRRLASDGYTVGECLVETRFESDGEIIASYEYLLVAVLVDGQWLVAEDVIISMDNIEQQIQEEAVVVPVINIDEVSEFANEYTDLIFTGNDASHLRMGSDFGYNGKHLLVYYAPLDFDSSVVNMTREYGVYTLPDGFRNDVTLSIMNDGYTVAEYWARDEFTDKATGRILGYREYCVTCALIDGQWCVAEDIGIASEVY